MRGERDVRGQPGQRGQRGERGERGVRPKARMLNLERSMSAAESAQLTARLADFYTSTDDYTAFQTPSHQAHCWAHVKQEIIRLAATGRPVRVLEVGAGKSGFADWLRAEGLRGDTELSAQDVTPQNRPWLQERFDHVHIGSIRDIPDRATGVDIAFSTYVLEHVVDPQRHLGELFSLLSARGSLFIFCPRYDVPGYLPPSTRHLSATARLTMVARVLRDRIMAIVSGKPAFIIQTDLAVFHTPFFTDADACHWASMIDLRLWARQQNARFSSTPFGAAGSLKQWIVFRLLTCGAKISRAGA